jgi:hypothetical protein
VIAKYDCSRAVQKVAGTGDPNLMSFNDGSDVGNVDCGWRQDGVRATVSDDWQCRAHAGYDGPSGVGTPRSNQVFRTTATARLTVPGTATGGSPVTASGSGNVTVRGDSLESCAFYWGDGSPGTQVPCSAGQTVSAQHTYRSAGIWAAKLVVVDTQGERVTATRPVKASYRPARSKSTTTGA